MNPGARTNRDKHVTVGTLRREASARLAKAGIGSAALDARLLVARGLEIEEAAVFSLADAEVEPAKRARLEALLQRRIQGEPIARILGRKEFWSSAFALGPDTLVPRPESETVVEAALAALPDRKAALSVLDLGTGTGALLAAILLERPAAFGVGIDRSERALQVARDNLRCLGLAGRVALVCGDWSAAIAGRFDLVVANPPYIARSEFDRLPAEVRDHDPRLALDGGSDGLDAYRAILPDLTRLLAPGGIAVLELGQGQEASVGALARAAGLFAHGPARRDLLGISRALVIGAQDPKITLGSRAEPH
jgi:release factor glutamine methyltransferase